MIFPFDEREIVLRADFDRIDEGNVLSVPVRFEDGPRPPTRGEFVYLLDGTGNGCVGFVAKVRDDVARILPVLETFTGPSGSAASPERGQGGIHQAIDPASSQAR